MRAKKGANQRALRQAWKYAHAPGANGMVSVRHSCGLNCSGMAEVRNMGPYIPLCPMKCSSSIPFPASSAARKHPTTSALLSTASARTSASGRARRRSSASVRAARANWSPPSR